MTQEQQDIIDSFYAWLATVASDFDSYEFLEVLAAYAQERSDAETCPECKLNLQRAAEHLDAASDYAIVL